MIDQESQITAFLAGSPHAVIGASRDRGKYGNKVLRAYMQQNRSVYPVHPRETDVEGLVAYPDLGSIPAEVHGVSVITPPALGESIVEQAATRGIQHIWFQPGAESDAAVARAKQLGMSVIANGPCILVTLRYHE